MTVCVIVLTCAGSVAGLHVRDVLQHGGHQVGPGDVPASGQELLQVLGASKEAF